jgi:hypothetical protein
LGQELWEDLMLAQELVPGKELVLEQELLLEHELGQELKHWGLGVSSSMVKSEFGFFWEHVRTGVLGVSRSMWGSEFWVFLGACGDRSFGCF